MTVAKKMITITPSENGQRLHGERGPFGVGVGMGQEPSGGPVEEEPQRFADVSIGERVEPRDLHLPGGHGAPVAPQHDPEGSQQRGGEDRRRQRGQGPTRSTPPSKAGMITSSVTRPSTIVPPTAATENNVAPATAMANGRGWVRIVSQSSANAASEDAPVGQVPASLAMIGATASMASACTTR